MIEYRKVVQFNYKNNIYNMYLDNKNKHFFLKVDSFGNYLYITVEELFELTQLFYRFPNFMNVQRDFKLRKLKIIPKIVVGSTAVTLSFLTLLTCFSLYNSSKRLKKFEKNYANIQSLNEESLQNYVAYGYKNIDEFNADNELVVDTYLESDWLNYYYIYDMAYLDKVLDYDEVSLEQLSDVIFNNSLISNKFKELLIEYCNSVINKYPDIDLRVLYENLKTLEVIECDKDVLLQKTLSVDSYGCYIRTENKIYVLKDCDYKKGNWAYQVIFHEFSHCLRTAVWDIEGREVRVQIEGQNFYNVITAEALNSLFTISLFDYVERDVAYQLQSNYHSVILECVDNYKLSDYVNHSLSYYAKKLDEFNGDDNYSTVILELIQVQYDEYHNSSVKVDQSEYYQIYDYISDMYYYKYITSDMSYNEARQVANELLNKILFDVPEDYNIDVDYFYEYLDKYCNSIGIDKNLKIK